MVSAAPDCPTISTQTSCSSIYDLLQCLTTNNNTFTKTLGLVSDLQLADALDSPTTRLTFFAAPDTTWLGPTADEMRQVGPQLGPQSLLYMMLPGGYGPEDLTNAAGEGNSSLASALSEAYAALEQDVDFLKALPLRFVDVVGEDVLGENATEVGPATVQVCWRWEVLR